MKIQRLYQSTLGTIRRINLRKLSLLLFFTFILPLGIYFWLFNPCEKISLDSSDDPQKEIIVTNEDFLRPSFKSFIAMEALGF